MLVFGGENICVKVEQKNTPTLATKVLQNLWKARTSQLQDLQCVDPSMGQKLDGFTYIFSISFSEKCR